MMTPPEAVAVISDLHLSFGTQWTLEDFQSDTFMPHLVHYLEGRFDAKRLDLVLLGDAFDLWQAVPEADLTAAEAAQIHLDLDIAVYQQALDRIASEHQKFFEALGQFSQKPGHRLVIIAGNHDHALVDDGFKATLKDILVNRFNFLDRGDNLVFQNFYNAANLGVYMEHGNQYDEFNQYVDFGTFGPDPKHDECRGYGLVRLFWNRLENLDVSIDDSPEHWGEWFNWLRQHGKPGTIFKAWVWNRQYQQDPRVDPISIGDYMKESALSVTSEAGEEHLRTPDILLNAEDTNRQMVFSNDLVVEGAYRELYQAQSQEGKEFRQVADEIMKAKFAPDPGPDIATLPPLGDVPHLDLNGPAKPIYPAVGVAARSLMYGEPLMRNLQGMFTPGQGPKLYRDAQGRRIHLDARIYQMVVMGHTHDPKWEKIPSYKDKLYANTGTWTTRETNGGGKTQRTVVMVERLASQEIQAEAGVINDLGDYEIVHGPQPLPQPAPV
jgi:UDP-2,3-diacylglucosamine pyrophosphatase LpxH